MLVSKTGFVVVGFSSSAFAATPKSPLSSANNQRQRLIKAIIQRTMISTNLLPSSVSAYIDGKWVPADSGSTFDVTNPSTGEKIGVVADCGTGETKAAIAAAAKAYKTWGFNTTAKERCGFLSKLYAFHIQHKSELASILTKEMGKPIAEAEGEIMYSAGFLDWFAGEGRRGYGDIIPPPAPGRQMFAFQEPIGVAGIITPWNFPSAMIVRKVAAAFAAGCTVVIKPSEDTPLSALAFAKMCEEAGLPSGVLNVVPASRDEAGKVGQTLCHSPDVATISFTGSSQVGKTLLSQCASTVKRVSLELGGNAPFMVFNSADVDKAVIGAMGSKFRCSGQTCVCANRFYVQSGIYDEFVAKLKGAMEKELKMGDGFADGVTQGPLVNDRAVNKVRDLVDEAVGKGASAVLGGSAGSHDNFYPPTLLTGVQANMDIASAEIFGPVAAIMKFETEEEGLEKANNCRQGLAGYFYSQDIAQIFRVARRMEVGMIGANEGLISAPEAPFGGVKESGLGREGGNRGLDEFTQIKYVCLGGL